MAIPYRTRRRLERLGSVLLVLLVIFIVVWLCWVVWLQRYVVYTSDGARLDFAHSSNDLVGEVAKPPVAASNISIFYNEGADAINTSHDLVQINGYYITSDMFKQELPTVLTTIARLPAGTAVMIEMKGPYGSFYYPTNLSDATISASTDVNSVADLVKRLQTKGFYTIAQISAFRDREFGNKNVPTGLYMLSRAGLWMDKDGMFWLNPTNATATSWITSVILELRDMGFNEVLLDNFCFPNTDQFIFNGDKLEALQAAAKTLVASCNSSNFVLSFALNDPAFKLPDDRCRIYLSDVGPGAIEAQALQYDMDDPQARLVFITDNGDTRYDNYSVLRSLHVAEEVEARRAD